jgi:signal transduction histidine kinase
MLSTNLESPPAARIEVFRPEYHAFVYKAVFEVADEAVGRDVVDQLLARYGVKREQFSDPEAWVSGAFTEAFMQDLYAKADDPRIFTRVGRLAMTPAHLGPRHAFMRAFATPMMAYVLIAKSSGTMQKTRTYAVQRTSKSTCTLEVVPVPGAEPEKSSHLCDIRSGMISGVPAIFGLPRAHVEHPKCAVRGDECCTYEVSWVAPIRPGLVWLASGMAFGGGTLYSVLTGAGLVSAALVTGAAVGCSWLAAAAWQLQSELGARTRDVLAAQDALEVSLLSNERRFSELLEAKANVDQKVEQRTTELRAAMQQLSETLQRVREIEQSKTDFFNNVSHELRSPLTLILAPLEELLAGRTAPSRERETFATMHRNAARLLQLINQLLDLAKIDAGQMTIAPSATDLKALMGSIVARFSTAAQTKGVSLDLNAPSEMPVVMLDAAWIESAITNLMANALRLTPSGGGVRICIQDSGSEVTLSVSDDGPGIVADDHKKVFERFAQGDSSKRVVGGTGIGLALVREAARLHGGDVKLVSELGHGATFTLRLPRRLAPQSEMRSSVAPGPSQLPPRLLVDDFAPERESIELAGPSLNAPLALVVEDNPELRVFIANVLAERYRVRATNDGKKGVALALEARPDVVVSDVAMPEMDGIELCRQLRARPETRATPILLVTARTEVSSVLKGFEAGASDYIHKPFHGHELLARVDVHVRLRRMMQEFAVRERHAALGVLAASVAHQVRNPLTSLVSGLPAMRKRLGSSVGESTQELMDVMIDCAERIDRLIGDLMDLSRVDRELSGPYRPSDGLRAAIRLVQARLASDVRVEEEISDAPIIEGRAGDMNHVFLNLLDNAAKAAGDTGRIHIEAATQDDAYVVCVGDSGRGVDDSIAPHVFEPFFTTRVAGEGTGLGLAVAQQVVLQCGGTIKVGRSKLGGALFTVRIPLELRASLEERPEPEPEFVGRVAAG